MQSTSQPYRQSSSWRKPTFRQLCRHGKVSSQASPHLIWPTRLPPQKPTTQPLTLVPEINLSELQKSLDKTALEVVDNQKENMVGRKKLAEQTRGVCRTGCDVVAAALSRAELTTDRVQEAARQQ